jgi:hypothetical protein
MTMSFGVTDMGFVLPSQQDLLALVVADQVATINANIDTSSDSPIGQLNGVFTRQLMLAYEGLQVAYNSNDPDAVEGFLLTQLSALTGTARDAAFTSTVSLNCTLTIGTTLLAGITLAAIAGNPASQWTPVSDYTAAIGGVQAVPFQSTTTGANAADIGTITVITTPVTGWTAVTNPAAAALGEPVESDPAIRIRREQELEGGGAGNVDAIRAALLKLGEPGTPLVSSAFMLNNTTDFVDVNGLPPHSTEAIVYAPTTGSVTDNAIAQVLWDEGSSGVQNFGTTSGVATDKLGNPHTVAFTRVTQLPVYIAVALTARATYPGDLAFKTSLANICSGAVDPNTPPEAFAFGVGVSVDPYDVILNTALLGAKITGLDIELTTIIGTPGSITASAIAVGPRQIAVFDASRITVNGV